MCANNGVFLALAKNVHDADFERVKSLLKQPTDYFYVQQRRHTYWEKNTRGDVEQRCLCSQFGFDVGNQQLQFVQIIEEPQYGY